MDVFIGSYPDAPEVYVVQQMKRKQWDVADEQKCMINFASMDEAQQAYLGHYDDARFFGGITAMPVDEFVAKVRATREKPAMIKAQLFFKGYVGPYLRGGRIVNIAGYHGRSARATASPGQLSLFGSNEPLPPSPMKGKDPVASTPDLFDADEHGEMPPARRAVREPTHTEPTSELIAEHERLVDVLRSPSHDDDKAEAKKQAAELAEMKVEAGEHKKLLIVNPRTSQENNSQIKKDQGDSNLSNNSPVEAKQESSMQSSKPLAPTNRGARVTPQVASDRQLDAMIKIAADSIDKLRRSDVNRVIGEAPAHFRSHLAGHIKSKRKDLADDVDDVMSELRSAQAS